MKRILLFVTLFSSLCVLSAGVVFAVVTWSETQPGGSQDLSWTPSAMSSDGQKMIVGVQNGGLYISSNGGDSWTEINPSGIEDPGWYTANMSSDGEIIVVSVHNGRLYRSIDGGDNWSEMQPAGNSDYAWITTSMSYDGEIMLAGVRNGRLYRSIDGGDNWSETQPVGNTDQAWVASTMSSDGQKMVAAYQGRIFMSTNTGSSWVEIQPAGDEDITWSSVGMSSSGQVIVTGSNDRIYMSQNSGGSWAEIQPAGDTSNTWRIASVSSDGETIFAGSSERLYLSSDSGETWSQTQPAGDVNRDWALGSLSTDSQVLLAGVYSGRLYIGSNPPPTPTPNPNGGSSSNSTAPSTPTCATTPDESPDLFQINTTGSTATLLFAPVGQASNYTVSYGFSSDANQFAVITNQGSSTGALSYTVNALPNNSTMYFKVYAQNNCGQGNWSNVMQVTTNGRTYFKNLLSQVTSILPRQTTVLGAKTQKKVLGQKVACTTYTVQSGDSLWSIASEKLGSGNEYSSIVSSNNLSSTNLSVGQKLKVGC